MQIRFCFKYIYLRILYSISLFLGCLNYYIHVRVVFLYVGLLQWALGLSRTKGESPKDSYNATLRENPAVLNVKSCYNEVTYFRSIGK